MMFLGRVKQASQATSSRAIPGGASNVNDTMMGAAKNRLVNTDEKAAIRTRLNNRYGPFKSSTVEIIARSLSFMGCALVNRYTRQN
ncbi:hypothetical protein [Fimbriiglobus ruber]|uniref:hypothetical protein n=1 Tax=Fimbriiglobus ruber TaxID=1908690 RepID=UPI000B4C0FC2|nr:hypothetical protein [Fimbriiglobus ruber]